MPSPRDQLAALLVPFRPRLLDASARGSGWNSVWAIEHDGRPLALKVYGRRRARLRERLTDFSHRISGRTGYTAAARRSAEARCLAIWREAGFDVPAPVPPPAGFPRIPAPTLLMEFIPGRPLGKVLGAPEGPSAALDALFIAYVIQTCRRHDKALEAREPALLQEHPALDHVLTDGSRLCTIDLEVAYTFRRGVAEGISAEIAGLVRSLFKDLPDPLAGHYLSILAHHYPDRARLGKVWTDFFANGSVFRRLLHALDRRRSRGRFDKYAAAVRLRDALP